MEEELIKYGLQNGFAILVTAYLLYERSKLTAKLTDQLAEVAKTLAVISEKIK